MGISRTLINLLITALAVVSVESRSLSRRNAVLVPQVSDLFGNPLLYQPSSASTAYEPQRAMLFTGFYRPSRRSGGQAGDTASSVYAQGSSVGGGAYFSQPQYFLDALEPSDEGELASAEPEAPPAAAAAGAGAHPDDEHENEGQKYGHRDESDDQSNDKPEKDLEKPIEHRPSRKPTKPHSKKPKKMPKPVESEEEEEEEYENCDDDEEQEDEEEDEPLARPNKSRRRNKPQPNLNNYFPTVFNIPRTSSSRGNPGSIPDVIAAIANSYSTGKGGVASSVATAYGTPPSKKQRRISSKQ